MKFIFKASFILAFIIPSFIVAQIEIISEELNLKNDSIHLPGTLSFNENLDQQALVIYVHGSGNVDRNGNQAGAIKADYIQQLSEALNKNGIAFYRYDKRTATQENMKYLMQGISFLDFVKDVQVAVEHFKDDSRFSSIVLIGHSQGSLVGMLALSEDVDKYISIAGPASSIDEIMTKQIRKQNGDSLAGIVDSHFKELDATGTIEEVNPMLFQLFNPQNISFYKSWMIYSPVVEIKKINIPTLIVNGTKDLQVPVEEAYALQKAKPDAELKLIQNMNHVLKHIEKDEDNFESYNSPDFPLSEELVEVISSFIKK